MTQNTMKQQARNTGDIMLGCYREDECFALEVTDYGFYPNILPGDTVIVHKQPDIENGDIAVVMIDCDAKTILRRINHDERGGMILTADNPIFKMTQNKRYDPIVIDNNELHRVHIFGKAISIIRSLTRTAEDVNE